MGHHLTTFIARAEVLRRLAVPRLRLAALPQGLSLAPMPDDLLREIGEERDLGPEEILDELAAAASRWGAIGWLMSDYFGGAGSKESALFREGRRVLAQDCNRMLAELGVQRVRAALDVKGVTRVLYRLSGIEGTLLDEWDSVGLGGFRHTASTYERATPVEPLTD